MAKLDFECSLCLQSVASNLSLMLSYLMTEGVNIGMPVLGHQVLCSGTKRGAHFSQVFCIKFH